MNKSLRVFLLDLNYIEIACAIMLSSSNSINLNSFVKIHLLYSCISLYLFKFLKTKKMKIYILYNIFVILFSIFFTFCDSRWSHQYST